MQKLVLKTNKFYMNLKKTSIELIIFLKNYLNEKFPLFNQNQQY